MRVSSGYSCCRQPGRRSRRAPRSACASSSLPRPLRLRRVRLPPRRHEEPPRSLRPHRRRAEKCAHRWRSARALQCARRGQSGLPPPPRRNPRRVLRRRRFPHRRLSWLAQRPNGWFLHRNPTAPRWKCHARSRRRSRARFRGMHHCLPGRSAVGYPWEDRGKGRQPARFRRKESPNLVAPFASRSPDWVPAWAMWISPASGRSIWTVRTHGTGTGGS